MLCNNVHSRKCLDSHKDEQWISWEAGWVESAGRLQYGTPDQYTNTTPLRRSTRRSLRPKAKQRQEVAGDQMTTRAERHTPTPLGQRCSPLIWVKQQRSRDAHFHSPWLPKMLKTVWFVWLFSLIEQLVQRNSSSEGTRQLIVEGVTKGLIDKKEKRDNQEARWESSIKNKKSRRVKNASGYSGLLRYGQ